MVPDGDGIWNYNFMGAKWRQDMRYSLKLDLPLEFYNELHRPAHFLNFAAVEDEGFGNTGAGVNVEVDREDEFS
ncbi:hypothetical protein HDU93_009920 [Gonapodya sp. JEL0774]|nr:hypothetical protein HDU93_009920 [Gonapodya sp. JEL0774]